MSALRGKRVLVTRAAEDRGALDDLLAARGAVPVPLPCIEFAPPLDRAPLDAVLQRLRGGTFPHAVVLASAHAVDRFVAELRSAGVDPAGALRASVVAVAGQGTAQRLASLGIRARVPDQGVGAEALAAMLAAGIAGKHVLVPRAEGGNPGLVDRLRASGALVEAVTLYRTATPKAPDPAGALALREGSIDAVAFASGSAARGFAQLFGADAAMLASRCRVACMGRACAAEAAACGLPVDATADGGFAELVDSIERALSDRTPARP
jgi:uroporphyrinogen-III synthase